MDHQPVAMVKSEWIASRQPRPLHIGIGQVAWHPVALSPVIEWRYDSASVSGHTLLDLMSGQSRVRETEHFAYTNQNLTAAGGSTTGAAGPLLRCHLKPVPAPGARTPQRYQMLGKRALSDWDSGTGMKILFTNEWNCRIACIIIRWTHVRCEGSPEVALTQHGVISCDWY